MVALAVVNKHVGRFAINGYQVGRRFRAGELIQWQRRLAAGFHMFQPRSMNMSDQAVMPEVPEGLDEAIFRQGWLAGVAGAVNQNAFSEGTPQAEAWQAGYDAGVPAEEPAAAEAPAEEPVLPV